MPAATPIKPDIEANSFGLSGGGPIVRNRAFFFGTYEGVRRPNEVTLNQVVPPDAWRGGDLSSVVRPDSQSRHRASRSPSNQIPVNPTSAKILESFYARQNQSTGAAINAPNFIVNAPGDYTVNGFDGRVDAVLTTQPEGLRPAHLEERGRPRARAAATGTRRRAITSSAPRCGRSPASHNWVHGALRQRAARRLVEHGGEGQLHERAAGRRPGAAGRPGRARRPAGHGRLSALRVRGRVVHLDRRREAVRHPLARRAGQRHGHLDTRPAHASRAAPISSTSSTRIRSRSSTARSSGGTRSTAPSPAMPSRTSCWGCRTSPATSCRRPT